MPAKLIDGVAIARSVRDRVARETAALKSLGITPGLAVILVGDDPASATYVRSKGLASEEAGIHSSAIRLPAETTQAELLARIDELNLNESIHGILVQMPLPPQIDPDAVILRVDPAKDVDGFHPVNVGKLLIGQRDGFVSCTPAGVIELLRAAHVETAGKECVIIGRSMIVGRPMAALLVQNTEPGNCTVTVCHSRTRDLRSHTLRAEILIVAAGRAGLVTGDMVRPGAVVVDVGMNRIPDASTRSGSRLVGDVDFSSVREVASKITPVPGGVGPMTIAMLLSNTVLSASRFADARTHAAGRGTPQAAAVHA
ncbi:MAG TPA: bifunctional methylenetetrahydrofolate dehydrogenase/methenyltetrahydrofolate cyclohydrolase FolD [Gemmatimonadaceae bacterium]|nr:bifunctional methylenetetrahydrofolate dehydrogenase/methenyltetrahydrofolate cyclohydrolase FolD [Gemmatimonadaceae bacterium]